MVSGIGIHPVSGALGAEVSGVDLAKHLDDDTVAVLRRAWLEHLVLLFRDQSLTPPQLLAFARRFGNTIEYPFVKGLEEYPDIIPVVKLEHERINFGGVWHSDTAYLDMPPMAAFADRCCCGRTRRPPAAWRAASRCHTVTWPPCAIRT